ncbi:MAG: zinc-binding dehydrogenase [Chloroflexi bacterium]|uniref:zinc-binding dehydrogenase n=1 Tax=Candidatus Flexifilum breve TaxID=3140694 RepID=UPI003135DF8E|nr:zinc-binding dehydrogenase [Chloroflexota bacterium]
MRAVVIHEHGGRDKLLLEQVPTPEAGAGQILVRVKACGLNYLDIFVRRGMPGLPIELPRITGGDIAGVIEAVGAGVTSVSVGQRVLLDPAVVLPDGEIGALGENTTGGLAEYIVVPAENAIPLPDDVTFEQSAALPIAYGTAWRMLITRGQVQPGESVFILGASGGVGTGAVQIAKMRGCIVYVAASSADKLERLKGLGADVLVNYAEQPEFHRFIKGHTHGAGVDVVVNYTGGDTWVKSLKCVKLGGRLLTCGATAGYDPQTDIRYIWRKEMDIRGSDGWQRQDLIDLLEAVRSGQINPVIDRVLPLEETAEGHRLLEDREVFGKVIIVP